MKVISPIEKYCIGCKLCEVHCIAAHSKSKNMVTAFKNPARPLTRIRVEEHMPVTIAINCQHCDNPPCVSACMSNALFKNDDGVVSHDGEKCIGCWMCEKNCQKKSRRNVICAQAGKKDPLVWKTARMMR